MHFKIFLSKVSLRNCRYKNKTSVQSVTIHKKLFKAKGRMGLSPNEVLILSLANFTNEKKKKKKVRVCL